MEYINEFKSDITYIDKISKTKLIKMIKYANNKYYNTGEEILSDYLFDKMVDKLREIDPNNDYFNTVGEPAKHKVKLPFFMGSLTKVKPDTVLLDKFLEKTKTIYVSDKLDGVSIQLYLKDGKSFLYSRGDGTYGQNITPLIDPIICTKYIPDDVSIRGEFIIPKNYHDISTKNLRNVVSGLINQKKFNKDIANITKFVSYSILYPKYDHSEQLKLLKKYKMNVVTFIKMEHATQKDLIEYYIQRRKDSIYNIDGLVLTTEDGNSVAFKMDLSEQMGITTIIKINWEITMYGYLQPVINVEPIELLGSTIQYISAYNAKYVKDNKLSAGVKVKIIKSGDIIPKIVEVMSTSMAADMPDIEYEWTDTNVDIRVKNVTTKIQQQIDIKRIVHFMKKLNIKYINEGIITNMYQNGYTNVIDIIREDKFDLVGIGKKLSDKITEEIKNKLKNVQMYNLMSASLLFGRGLGSKKLKTITDKYKNIKKLTKDKILELEGFDDILATQFIKNIPEFLDFYDKINKYMTIVDIKPKGDKLKNKTIVFTGFRNENLENFIISQGGKMSNNVSKNTYLIVYTDSNSNKYIKGKELGIKLMTREEFVDWIKKFENASI